MNSEKDNRTFFTEASFCQWLGTETHKSRLADRLNKVGIILSQPLKSSSSSCHSQETEYLYINDNRSESDQTSIQEDIGKANTDNDIKQVKKVDTGSSIGYSLLLPHSEGTVITVTGSNNKAPLETTIQQQGNTKHLEIPETSKISLTRSECESEVKIETISSDISSTTGEHSTDQQQSYQHLQCLGTKLTNIESKIVNNGKCPDEERTDTHKGKVSSEENKSLDVDYANFNNPPKQHSLEMILNVSTSLMQESERNVQHTINQADGVGENIQTAACQVHKSGGNIPTACSHAREGEGFIGTMARQVHGSEGKNNTATGQAYVCGNSTQIATRHVNKGGGKVEINNQLPCTARGSNFPSGTCIQVHCTARGSNIHSGAIHVHEKGGSISIQEPIGTVNLPQAVGGNKCVQLDPLFFNNKDRGEKYYPEILGKKPRHKKSQFTIEEQRHFFQLFYRNQQLSGLHGTEDEMKQFKELQERVRKEQWQFQSYLKNVSYKCKKDYQYIHSEADKYINARYLAKRQHLLCYPRYYNLIDKILLTDDVADNPPHLHYVRPLLELGCVNRLVIPSIIQGLPQPCTPMKYNKVAEVCPPMKDVFTGPYVWNKEVCSRDMNAERLAVPNKCDIVMSASAVKYLIDNQGNRCKYWDMPVTVKEYQITVGNVKITHKVVYIDKPFIRISEYTPKDKNQLYQKYALKAVSVRPKQKAHVFSNIRPSHTQLKAPAMDVVQNEIDAHEGELKTIFDKDAVLETSVDVETGSDQEEFSGNFKNWGKEDKVLKRKRHKENEEFTLNEVKDQMHKFSVGMFDVEKDIDDLETFGMESLWKSKSKCDKKVDHQKDKQLTLAFRVGRKSATEELEILKTQLQGIQKLARNENLKSPGVRHIVQPRGEYEVEENSNNTVNSSETLVRENYNEQANIHQVGSIIEKPAIITEQESVSLESDQVDKCATNVDDAKSDSGTCKKFTGGVTSAKGSSSLSAKMKQMSAIKSKLQMFSNGKPNANIIKPIKVYGTRSRTLSKDSVVTDIEAWLDVTANSLVSITDETNIVSNNVTENLSTKLMIENDSDNDSDGLVIDVPSPPIVEISAQLQDNKSKEDITVLEELNDLKQDDSMENTEGYEKFNVGSVRKTRSTLKRRNQSEVPEVTEISSPKRVLRSFSILKDKTDLGNKTIDSKPDLTDLGKSELLPDVAEPAHTRWRGRKHELDVERSASVDSHVGPKTSPVLSVCKRVTRISSGTMPNVRTELMGDIEQVAVKRIRSNPKQSHDMKELKHDAHVADVKEDNNLIPSDDSIGRGQDKATQDNICRGQDKATQDSQDTVTLDQLFGSGESLDQIDDVPKKRGRPCKKNQKNATNEESQKIHEMAENMNTKIDETIKENHSWGSVDSATEGQCKDGNNVDAGTIDTTSVANSNAIKPPGMPDDVLHSVRSFYKCRSDQSPSKLSDPLKDYKQDSTTNKHEGALDSILSMQTQTFKPTLNQGSAHDVFAAKHGLEHVDFPVDENVTYHQWCIGDLNVLIRCKYHGHSVPEGLLHICPKIEYQPFFGYEKDTINETARNWISVLIRPNSSLLRARINPFNSEIMMFEHVKYMDIIPSDSKFSQVQAFTDLHLILKRLQSLNVGQYLLKNNPRKDVVRVYQVAEDNKRGQFDLHLHYATFTKNLKPPSLVQWVPIDTHLLLPHHKKMNLIPCTFQPLGFVPGDKKKSKKKKKKK